MANDNKFAFYWKVYDTYYGYLQDDIDRVIQQDIISLFNISRSLTSVVREKYPWCTFIKINAPTHLTKNRILTRKRGNIEQKEMRIKRMSKEFKLPDDIIRIDNSGSLEDLQNKIKIVCNTLFPKLT